MSTIIASQRQSNYDPVRGTEGEAPGIIETIGASFRLAEDDQELTQAPRSAAAYDELLDSLADLGVDTSPKGRLFRDASSSIPGALATQRVPDRDAIYAEVLRQRGRDARLFRGLPQSREEYDRWVATRRGARQTDSITASRGSVVGRLAGGVASGMTDPYNLATLPAGAGQVGVVRTMLVESVLGGVTELPNLATTARARARMGESFTARDAVEQVATSAAASGVLAGVGRTIELKAPAAVDGARARLESVVADHWDKLPEAVRARWSKGATIADADLPDLAEIIVGRGNMSVDERAAIDALRRDAQVEAGSPFKPGAPGAAAHRVRLDEALESLLKPVTRQSTAAPLPMRPDMPVSRGTLSSGTALASPAPTPAREQLKARIRRAESGGNDAARNPRSTATGRYQFIDATWLSYYKRRFGARGLSNSEILAKRTDPVIQEALMNDLTADNARFLSGIGEAESAGNLYLVHFAGPDRARRLFSADPSASARSVMGADAINRNPFLARMTAGDVIAWAHRKMNEPAPMRAGARAELPGLTGATDESAWRRQLQEMIDRSDAERAQLREREAATDPVGEAMAGATAPPQRGADADAFDAVPVPRDAADDLLDLPPPRDAVPAAVEGMTDRELAIVPGVRAAIGEGARLSDLAALAKRVEASEDEVRRALAHVASFDKSILQDSKGRFRRAPTQRGPEDALTFLARRGGITPHGLSRDVPWIPPSKLKGAERNQGHDLITIFEVRQRNQSRRLKGGGKATFKQRGQYFVPGAGPLLSSKGNSLDEAGEMLFEAHYLRGANGDRPSVAEVIDYLARAMDPEVRRTMVPETDMGGIDAYVAPQTVIDQVDELNEWAHYHRIAIDEADTMDMARMMVEDGLNEYDALTALTNMRVAEVLNDARYEVDEYGQILADLVDDLDAGSHGGRHPFDPRNPIEGQSGADAGDEFADIAQSPIISLDPDADWNGWNDAIDDLAADQTASVRHDLDAEYPAPEPAPTVGDDATVMDGEAGDAVPFYLDENGDPRNWADIQAEMDLDDIEIQNMKDCL